MSAAYVITGKTFVSASHNVWSAPMSDLPLRLSGQTPPLLSDSYNAPKATHILGSGTPKTGPSKCDSQSYLAVNSQRLVADEEGFPCGVDDLGREVSRW